MGENNARQQQQQTGPPIKQPAKKTKRKATNTKAAVCHPQAQEQEKQAIVLTIEEKDKPQQTKNQCPPTVEDMDVSHSLSQTVAAETNSAPLKPVVKANAHPAWVPGATLSTPRAGKSFDEVFPKAFSPFQFTGAKNTPSATVKASFGFRKPVDQLSKDSLEASECEEEGIMDTSCAEDRRSRSDDSVEIINHAILHNHEMSNTINDRQETEEECKEEVPVDSVAATPSSEFAPFRQLYDDVIDIFTALCEKWEETNSNLEKLQKANETGLEHNLHLNKCV